MKPRPLVPAATASLTLVAALAAFAVWRTHDPAAGLAPRLPGMDGRPAAEAEPAEHVAIGESFESFDGKPSSLGGSWPRFRGTDFDNICKDGVPLADRWPEGGPKVLWSVDLGEGYAAAAVHRGRVYVLDYDEKKKADALRCLSLDDGREIWRRSYRVKVQRNHGMSRTVPAVTGAAVVTIGPRCHVMAVDPEDGRLKWSIDMEREFGAVTPLWYNGQCPLIDGRTVVLAPCGRNVLLAVGHVETGKIVWQTPNPHGWPMSHSSVMPMNLGGRRMYVYCSQGGVVGVSAMKEDAGGLLWTLADWNGQVLAPSPLVLDGGLVYVTAGYNAGSLMFKVAEKDGVFEASSVRRLSTQEGLASEMQTPLYYQGHIFSIMPKDAGALRQQMVCVRSEDHGKVVWSSGRQKRFGLGPYILADGKIFILNDDGVLTMIRASTERYEELAEAKVLQGQDSWGPIALAGGRMILRDSRRMICLEVGRQ